MGAVGDKEISQEAALEPESLPEGDEEAIEASEEKRGVIKMADPGNPAKKNDVSIASLTSRIGTGASTA